MSSQISRLTVPQDKQGRLQLLCTWKDAVQYAISSLTAEYDVGIWNWDDTHDLGNIKMFPLAWRTLLHAVYKTTGYGSPSSDYMLTGLHANQD
jgi:hypothetical protein